MEKVLIVLDGTPRSIATAAAVRIARPDLEPVFYCIDSYVHGDNNCALAVSEEIRDMDDAPHATMWEAPNYPWEDASLDEGSAIPPLSLELYLLNAASVAMHLGIKYIYVPGYDVIRGGGAIQIMNQIQQLASLNSSQFVNFIAPYAMASDAEAIKIVDMNWPEYYHVLTMAEFESEEARAEAFAEAGIPDPHELAVYRDYEGHQLPEGDHYAPDLVEAYTARLRPGDTSYADALSPDLI